MLHVVPTSAHDIIEPHSEALLDTLTYQLAELSVGVVCQGSLPSVRVVL